MISLGDFIRESQGPDPVYSNRVEIFGNPAEVRLAFSILHLSHSPTPVATVIMTPLVAKALMEALTNNIRKWEEQHGHITMPEDAEVLTRGLFNLPGGPNEQLGPNQSDRQGPDNPTGADGAD